MMPASTVNATPLYAALVGNPNCGKTALFNRLTGSRQKVANYAGVTVERKEGRFLTPGARSVRLLDLPGAYSLSATSPDENVTREICLGLHRTERAPELLICVVDATNLRLHLRFALEVRQLGRPMLIVVNMMDEAARRGVEIDLAGLSTAIGVPVIPCVSVRRGGAAALLDCLDRQPVMASAEPADRVAGKPAAPDFLPANPPGPRPFVSARHATDRPGPDFQTQPVAAPAGSPGTDVLDLPHRLAVNAQVPDAIAPETDAIDLHAAVRALLRRYVHTAPTARVLLADRLDRVFLHPVAGPAILLVVLFVMFQTVFSWAQPVMDLLQDGMTGLGALIGHVLPPGVLRSLIVDAVVAGAGTVVVYLPQILILFLWILALEESGYLPRAAFLLDRIMASAGLSGRSFIPLLSSFACAIPGIMATRTIQNPRDRLVTILIAPLMTCSARLPVYTLLIGAFVPHRRVLGAFSLQGLVLFGLYACAIASGLVLARVMTRGVSAEEHPLLLELPLYRRPVLRNLALGLWQRATMFLSRVGTIIVTLNVLLWALSSFPGPPVGATGAAIDYSLAGRIGHWMMPVFSPIGFNWEICVSLIPGLAAREVAVSALATVYALGTDDDDAAARLTPLLSAHWSLATALSLLAWYIFAPQCLSTLAVIRRETGSLKIAIGTAAYLFALAYGASLLTYQLARLFGGA